MSSSLRSYIVLESCWGSTFPCWVTSHICGWLLLHISGIWICFLYNILVIFQSNIIIIIHYLQIGTNWSVPSPEGCFALLSNLVSLQHGFSLLKWTTCLCLLPYCHWILYVHSDNCLTIVKGPFQGWNSFLQLFLGTFGFNTQTKSPTTYESPCAFLS